MLPGLVQHSQGTFWNIPVEELCWFFYLRICTFLTQQRKKIDIVTLNLRQGGLWHRWKYIIKKFTNEYFYWNFYLRYHLRYPITSPPPLYFNTVLCGTRRPAKKLRGCRVRYVITNISTEQSQTELSQSSAQHATGVVNTATVQTTTTALTWGILTRLSSAATMLTS